MREGEAADLHGKSDPYGRAVVPAYSLCGGLQWPRKPHYSGAPRNAPLPPP
jgi:hypothetical protein